MKRIRQFWRALRPRFSERDHAVLARFLEEPERRLFDGLTPAFRRHALNVAHTLLAADADGPPLLIKAALLHDAGKQIAPLTLLHRVLNTLVPGLGEVAAEPVLTGWRRPFQVARHHARYGAELAERLGLASDLIEVIRCHHVRPAPNAVIERLQWADEQN